MPWWYVLPYIQEDGGMLRISIMYARRMLSHTIMPLQEINASTDEESRHMFSPIAVISWIMAHSRKLSVSLQNYITAFYDIKFEMLPYIPSPHAASAFSYLPRTSRASSDKFSAICDDDMRFCQYICGVTKSSLVAGPDVELFVCEWCHWCIDIRRNVTKPRLLRSRHRFWLPRQW